MGPRFNKKLRRPKKTATDNIKNNTYIGTYEQNLSKFPAVLKFTKCSVLLVATNLRMLPANTGYDVRTCEATRKMFKMFTF